MPNTISSLSRQRKRELRKPGPFTDRYIKSLKQENEMYQLREGRGFAIRVLPTEIKTWYYIYTFNGKRRHPNLGNYPDKSLEEAHKGVSRILVYLAMRGLLRYTKAEKGVPCRIQVVVNGQESI